jgi:hypothetical protein
MQRCPAGLLVLAASCHAAGPESPTPPVVVAPASEERDSPALHRAEVPDEAAEADGGRDVLIGTLKLTKGRQPLVDGVLLPRAAFDERFGPEWRHEVVGKRVRLEGRRRDHHCEPHAQCMIDGVIPLLEDIVAIDLCRGPDDPEFAGGVDCR